MILATVMLVGLCLLCQAFFSGSEIALVSANRLRLADAAEHRHGARLAIGMLAREDRLLGTCLIGTNLCVVSGTTLLSGALVASGYEAAWLALAYVPFALVLGEALPKTVMRHYATSLAPVLAYPLRAVQRLFALPLAVLGLWSRVLSVVAGADRLHVTRQDIVELLDSQEPEDIAQEERELIRAVFEIKNSTVETCMTPLVEVDALRDDATVGRAVEIADKRGRSRIPVFRRRIDAIVGFVECADLLFADDAEPLSSYMRPIHIVPESQPADVLLQELRGRREHIAMVVDEYGGSVGVVTVEDVLEELFGEIHDEHDAVHFAAQQLGRARWRVPARIEIDELAEVLEVPMPEGDYETLAGLVLARLGRIPRKGETVSVDRLELRVEEASDRAIRTVMVTILPHPAE